MAIISHLINKGVALILKNTYNILVFFVGMFVTLSVLSEELMDVEPFISVTLGYSDNIALKASDTSGSFYSEITPGFRLKREGARIKSNLEYSMQGILYSNTAENQSNSINNRLLANLTAELLENSLFIDLDSSITQELLDSRKTASKDNISGSDNLTDTYTYAFRPYWKGHWGDWADSFLSYDFSEVIYNSDDKNSTSSNDSKAHSARFSIQNGKAFRALFWNLELGYNHVDYQNKIDTHSDTSLLTLGYRLTNKLNLKSFFGYEEHNGQNSGNQGANYGAGLIWTPSTKSLLELSVGHRFYGRSYDFSFRQNMQRILFNFSYSESVTDTRSQIRENNRLAPQIGLVTSEGLVLDGNDGETVTQEESDIPLNSSTSSLYLSKRFAGSLNYKQRKSQYSLGTFHETRTFELSENNEKNYGFDLSWKWMLGKRTDAITALSWQHTDLNRDSVRSDDWTLSWTLNRQLSRKMSGNIVIAQRHKSSSVERDEFKEFRLYVALARTF